ncbi:CtpF protein, partial [Rhizobium ruizarguesonis]
MIRFGVGAPENMRPLPRISVHAFCESEALQRVMERCANDRRVAKVSMRITSGGTAA